jgi:hypothetical protein
MIKHENPLNLTSSKTYVTIQASNLIYVLHVAGQHESTYVGRRRCGHTTWESRAIRTIDHTVGAIYEYP